MTICMAEVTEYTLMDVSIVDFGIMAKEMVRATSPALIDMHIMDIGWMTKCMAWDSTLG